MKAFSIRAVLRGRPDRGQPQSTLVDALWGAAEDEQGFVIARRIGGERALPTDGGLVLLSPQRLCRHVLVCGATGSGKTETVLRLAYAVAKCSDAPVFYIDGKGDRETAARFAGLMADARRQTRLFPNEPFCGWRGEAHEIHARLMEIIDYAKEGPAAWYRDVAKNVLRLVCAQPDGPPRSSGQVLARMELDALQIAHPRSSAMVSLTDQQVRQVRLRYEAFFGQCREGIDGDWAWEDTNAAYVLLDSLALKEETTGLARFLFEDLAHYFTTRKQKSQFALAIVDEFSALASAGGMADRIEQARGFNTSLVLAPQAAAGMGNEREAERIRSSVETTILHRMNTPEEIVALAGTRRVIEHSIRYGRQGATGEGSARIEQRLKIDPNRVRALEPGQAYMISQGRSMRVEVLRAPDLVAPLPEPHELDRPRLDEDARVDGGEMAEATWLPF